MSSGAKNILCPPNQRSAVSGGGEVGSNHRQRSDARTHSPSLTWPYIQQLCFYFSFIAADLTYKTKKQKQKNWGYNKNLKTTALNENQNTGKIRDWEHHIPCPGQKKTKQFMSSMWLSHHWKQTQQALESLKSRARNSPPDSIERLAFPRISLE